MQDRIVGTTMPVLELMLDPGEAIFSESGELSWMTQSIVMQTSTQMGGGGGVGGVFKRALGGSSIFMSEYSAQGAAGMVAFAARLPGQIFPLDVAPQPGMGYLGHRHAFVCGTSGVQLSIGFQQHLGAGFFGGDGFRLQKIVGQGKAWCELSGEVLAYDLKPGESLRVHPAHVGLFQDTAVLDHHGEGHQEQDLRRRRHLPRPAHRAWTRLAAVAAAPEARAGAVGVLAWSGGRSGRRGCGRWSDYGRGDAGDFRGLNSLR